MVTSWISGSHGGEYDDDSLLGYCALPIGFKERWTGFSWHRIKFIGGLF
jgi:hypothetical protein